MGTPNDLAPPEWISHPATPPERAFHITRGLHALGAAIRSLLHALT